LLPFIQVAELLDRIEQELPKQTIISKAGSTRGTEAIVMKSPFTYNIGSCESGSLNSIVSLKVFSSFFAKAGAASLSVVILIVDPSSV
jgi:hypothetical protein